MQNLHEQIRERDADINTARNKLSDQELVKADLNREIDQLNTQHENVKNKNKMLASEIKKKGLIIASLQPFIYYKYFHMHIIK